MHGPLAFISLHVTLHLKPVNPCVRGIANMLFEYDLPTSGRVRLGAGLLAGQLDRVSHGNHSETTFCYSWTLAIANKLIR